MKLNFKYIIAAGLLVCMAGCDDKLETFEVGEVRLHLLPLPRPLLARKRCPDRLICLGSLSMELMSI